MSLFAALRNAPAVFQQVLDHFFRVKIKPSRDIQDPAPKKNGK
ncbi:hypothetical protein [Pedobacter sp. P26]